MQKTARLTFILLFLFYLWVALCSGDVVCASTNDGPYDDLTQLSITDLMDLDITSVAKKSQKLLRAAAAVYVITQEDIRRSGVTSIPEALRMAPGLQVARIDANKWAITARGFNSQFANKLLVLMDGRTLYSHLYSGVYWDVQDTVLEDIDRIEVIRGPGASLWGANAVNGVINIITKSAADTQGGLVTAGAGSEEKGFASARYGGHVGRDLNWRAYVKYLDRDVDRDGVGNWVSESWDVYRSGFRVDWPIYAENTLSVQGDIYTGDVETDTVTYCPVYPYVESFVEDEDISGGNILARWQRNVSNTAKMTTQFYYDRTERKNTIISETRDTLDIDFQHQFAVGSSNEIVWGFGYRYTQDEIAGSFSVSFVPDSTEDHLFSAFFQDEITVVPERLLFVFGAKLEHNDYSGTEFQPSTRISWTPNARNTLWAAVSRSVRTPSRADQDIIIHPFVVPPFSLENPSPLPLIGEISGDEDVDSEKLVTMEMGYRISPSASWSMDLALFYNEYDDFLSAESDMPFPNAFPTPDYLVIPTTLDNKIDGKTYGAEVMVEWRPLSWWQIQATYTYLYLDLDLDSDSQDVITIDEQEGGSPRHQVSLRASVDLPGGIDVHLWSRYVDCLPGQDIGSYVALDARIAWLAMENIEVALVGQNLIDDAHPEFADPTTSMKPEEIERSFYGKVTWRF